MTASSDRDKALTALVEAVGVWRSTIRPTFGGEQRLADTYDALMAIPLELPEGAPVSRAAPLTAWQASKWMGGPRAASVAGHIVRLMYDDYRHRLIGDFAPHATGGYTVDEMERALNGRHQTISARMHELRSTGWVYAEGTRPTRSGREAEVYFLSQQAKELLRGVT